MDYDEYMEFRRIRGNINKLGENKEANSEHNKKQRELSINQDNNLSDYDKKRDIRKQMRENKMKVLPDKLKIYNNEGELVPNFKFNLPGTILIFGKSGSGKSFLVKNFIFEHCVNKKFFHNGIYFTGTKYSGELKEWFHEKAIIQYTPEHLDAYLKKKQDECEKIGEKKMKNTFIVFDDLLGELSVWGGGLTNLIATCRHLKISCIFLQQYIVGSGSSTAMRENMAYTIAFPTKYKGTIKHLYDAFGYASNNEKEFKEEFVRRTSEEHTALLFDNKDLKCNFYYTIKACDVENMKIKF